MSPRIDFARVRQWHEHDDHRVIVDDDLVLIADGDGPSYGGYHAPFPLDDALDTLRATRGSRSGIEAAMRAAHAFMLARHEEYERVRAEELAKLKASFFARWRGIAPGLEAARRAADRVRPSRYEPLRGTSLAHFWVSVTAVCLRELVVVQAGNTRIYRSRAGAIEQLVLDHSLEGFMRRKGEPCPPEHRWVVVKMLGHPQLEIEATPVDVQPGDRWVLCTQHVWFEELVATCFDAPDLERALRDGLRGADGTAIRVCF